MSHHSHRHSNDSSCDCGHDHSREEHHSCGILQDGKLNDAASGLLKMLKARKHLPCARFVLKSSAEPDFSSVVLAPVFIDDGKETIAFLNSVCDTLLGLEQHGYISIDYGIPLEGFDYSYFRDSDAFRLFESAVGEAEGREGFLGNKAEIEFGSITVLR